MAARAFAGMAGGKQVVVFVAKEGPYQGRVPVSRSASRQSGDNVGVGAMSRFVDAISWDGQTVTLILFGLWPSGDERDLSTPEGVTAPGEIRRYQLEDTEDLVSDYRCAELDLVFLSVPDDLDRVIVRWLRAARHSGAVVAWFGFEGSFDFEHLLAADVANQVFAVADASGVSTALNDAERESQAWVARLAEARNHSGM